MMHAGESACARIDTQQEAGGTEQAMLECGFQYELGGVPGGLMEVDPVEDGKAGVFRSLRVSAWRPAISDLGLVPVCPSGADKKGHPVAWRLVFAADAPRLRVPAA